ncbi:1-deoxy-D-xylulose-5-phosphate reductoisomerase [Sedimentibacter hydroxybenzoicus DSM 7310]|uniref:1-deoxy-D-xylulose 5-phosphate reductoisomerase n=1 Tax=Sedimentibacter hydroxybenzoicus DSM 7310 TaxID=1123245 RepID=A0A974BK76_SEDHY|nr:1-deoxy-D-xylulose-5-phosphate reductoisomerase [Sedimentibacter hydroxybenzoicus]NYB74267.1 1-deoxy-D-xylulose-5-phosphate reductoisomerase [Sedimentibacter hydroxybenzoicus DSM 7310]
MKYISILGSTGSIGTQTLDVVREHAGNLKVCAITGNNNIELLKEQIIEFEPELCSVMSEEKALTLKKMLPKDCKTDISFGMDGLMQAAEFEKSEIAVTAISGMIGLKPTVAAIKKHKKIALANKETLVTGGSYIMDLAKKYNSQIIPVDSEHSAIFQCLMANEYRSVNKILLTASGGPFRGKDTEYLKNVTVEDALKHPNWSMGKKITIDSATLMNKGLEVIEAKFLFDIEPEQIEVLVHPQSIIHSGVEFIDHSTIAQLGLPDMRVPIQFALFYPERIHNSYKSLSLTDIGNLTFEKPDMEVFKCLRLAFDALKAGGTMPAVLNASNEVCVDLFLNKKISFLDIGNINEQVMLKHSSVKIDSIETILEAEEWTRQTIGSLMNIEH